MTQKNTLSLCAIAFLILATSTGIARGDGAGAFNFTQTFHNATQTMTITFPCTSSNGTLTITYNGVAHGTVLTSGIGAGTGWFTFTATGTAVFVPFDPTQPSFTGRFTVWDGQSINLKNFAGTDILVVHATGSDGSSITFNDVFHGTVSASGIVIFFDHPTCG